MEGVVVMKRVSFRVRNFDKEQFLTFDIDNDAELDEEILDFLEEEEPKGIVPVIFEEGEEFDTFSYNITDKIHLNELSNQEINAEMVLMVMRGLVFSLIDMAEYRIPLSYLVLHRNYIYIDSDYKVEFICIPLEDMQENVDINSFLRQFIASLRFDSSENGDYVAKLLTYVNNTAIFNLHNLLTLVEDLMEEHGIEIPEDNSSDIYVDYQEVKEENAVDLVEALDDEMEEDDLSEQDEAEDWFGDTTILREDSAEEAAEEEEIIEEVPEKESDTEEVENSVEAEAEMVSDEAELDEVNSENQEELCIDSESDIEEAEDVEDTEALSDVSEEVEITEEAVKPADIEDAAKMADAVEAAQEDEEIAEADMNVEEQEVSSIEHQEEIENEAQDIVDKLKKKVIGGSKKADSSALDGEETEGENTDRKKEIKKPTFKTKESTVTGVVIEDDFDEFLAEKEKEEQEAHHEESGLKIKKNIKINRASIVKNTQEELKAAEEAAEAEIAAETEAEETGDDEETVSNSILSQTIGATGILKGGTAVPKANPYLVRVNTDERIMITKQTFKIGKASMGVDYTVKGNSAVSRVHAIITSKDGIYYIKDNKSTNHTFVNGKALDDGENELLTHDSKIVLGDEEFIFKLR